VDRIFLAQAKNRALTGGSASLSQPFAAAFLPQKRAERGAVGVKNEIIERQISTFKFHISLFMK